MLLRRFLNYFKGNTRQKVEVRNLLTHIGLRFKLYIKLSHNLKIHYLLLRNLGCCLFQSKQKKKLYDPLNMILNI